MGLAATNHLHLPSRPAASRTLKARRRRIALASRAMQSTPPPRHHMQHPTWPGTSPRCSRAQHVPPPDVCPPARRKLLANGAGLEEEGLPTQPSLASVHRFQVPAARRDATPLDRHQLAAARGNERQQERQGQGWRRAARGDMHGRHHRLRRRAARRGVGSAVPAVVVAAAGDGGTGERAASRAGGAGDRPRRARALAGRAPRVGQARVLQPPPAAGRAAVPSAAEPGGVGDEGGQEHPGDGQGDGGEVGGVGGQGHRGGAREDHREGQEEGLAVGAAP
uniref:Uncharacterized protein n=1 Tax=Zea mays TaxID=4577 RepID=A0A804QGT2_MAIZE